MLKSSPENCTMWICHVSCECCCPAHLGKGRWENSSHWLKQDGVGEEVTNSSDVGLNIGWFCRPSGDVQHEGEGKVGCMEGCWRYGNVLLTQSILLHLNYGFCSSLLLPTDSLICCKIASSTGKSKDEAMSDYITKIKQLLEEAAASAWIWDYGRIWCLMILFFLVMNQNCSFYM